MAVRARFGVWWRMLRPFTLVASVAPVLGGTALAYAHGGFHTGRFLAFLLAAVLIQSATNMFNEYFDYVRGLDTRDHVGIAGTIVRDGVSPRVVITLAWMFLVAAELIAATRGLGYLLTDGRETARADLVIVAIVVLALLGKLSDGVLQRAERRLLAWRDVFDGRAA